MPSKPAESFPLIDHHCHPVVGKDLSPEELEDLLSESFAPAANGTSHWDKPTGLAVRRWCAPVLDLPKFCPPPAYVERRRELGAEAVNRRFLRRAGLASLLVDTGNQPDRVVTWAAMGELAGVPAYEVVRMEAVAEAVICGGVSAAAYAETFETELERATGTHVVGLKTIVAYRTGLNIDQSPPRPAEVAEAAGKWLRDAEATGAARMTDAVLERHLLWTGADLARRKRLPVQFHIGIGDPDITLHAVDPSRLTPFIKAVEPWKVDLTLLHCYPFHREAGLLSENFPHVYFDVGFVMNWMGPSFARVIDEALEVAPFTKQLYSSDGFGLAEFHYLGAVRFRAALMRRLDRWIQDDECSTADAERITSLICGDNARRIYPLGDPTPRSDPRSQPRPHAGDASSP